MSHATPEIQRLKDVLPALGAGGLVRWYYLRRLKKAKHKNFMLRW